MKSWSVKLVYSAGLFSWSVQLVRKVGYIGDCSISSFSLVSKVIFCSNCTFWFKVTFIAMYNFSQFYCQAQFQSTSSNKVRFELRLSLNQIYWTKFFLGHKTKFIQPTLPNKIYKIKSSKQNVWNVNNHIYQTKSFQTNQRNQINPTNPTKPNLWKIKLKFNTSLSWAWPSSASAC